jgi:2-polyprenyl-6-hydroxyphenyl methylase/3-demethylubiquinone-9 3-methyltransferase
MSARPLSDTAASIQSDEFVWDTGEHTEVHRHVLAPIAARLKAFGARAVLDLGCGNGALTASLAREGFSVTGVDHSQSGIDIAARRHPEARFSRHDLAEPLPAHLAGRFDAVVSVEVIEHLLLPRRLLDNARLALRDGGLLIVTTPYHGYWKNLAIALRGGFDAHWHPLRDYGHVKFFSHDTLTRLLAEQGFAGIDVLRVGRIPPLARSMIASAIRQP